MNGRGPTVGLGPPSLRGAPNVWQATLDESKLDHGAGFSVQAVDQRAMVAEGARERLRCGNLKENRKQSKP